jgi:hypothetical protein
MANARRSILVCKIERHRYVRHREFLTCCDKRCCSCIDYSVKAEADQLSSWSMRSVFCTGLEHFMCKRTSRMNAPIVQVRKGTHYLGCDWLLAPIFWPPRGGAGGLGSHRAGQKQLGRFVWLPTRDFAVSVCQFWPICLNACKLIL